MRRLVLIFVLLCVSMLGAATAIIYGAGSAQAKPATYNERVAAAIVSNRPVPRLNPAQLDAMVQADIDAGAKSGTALLLRHLRHVAPASGMHMLSLSMCEDCWHGYNLGERCYSPGREACCYSAWLGKPVGCICAWTDSLDGYTWVQR